MGDLACLWSETSELKTFLEKHSVPNCSIGFSTLMFSFLDHAVDHLGSFGSCLFTDVAPFESFNVLVE